MLKNILVPTDGSPLSQDAVRSAVPFAKNNGACITALYVKPLPQIPSFVDNSTAKQSQSEWNHLAKIDEDQASESLKFVEDLCAGLGVTCTCLKEASNTPYKAIIEAATRNGCDLIYMASHGRSAIGGLLLGSETTKVLAHSKIPVLVYR